MCIAALLAVGMLASSDFWLQSLTAPIRLFCPSRAYEIEMGVVSLDSQGGRSGSRVFSTLCLGPFQRASLGGLKSSMTQVREGREYVTRQTETFRITRLPFGLFHTQWRIEGSIKEPRKRRPTPLRLTASQIVPVGRVVRVDLGKDKTTGDKRTLEVSIKEEGMQPELMMAAPEPSRNPTDHQ